MEPSQSASMARASVSRVSPTLPPSAISASGIALALALAVDRDADVVEGRGDRRMRLVDRDADRGHLLKAAEQCIGDGAGRGLYQPVALGAKRLARDRHHLVVADRIGELVAARCLGQVDVEHEIEREGLADLGFVLHDAVIGVQCEPADEHLIGYAPATHLIARRALSTLMAWIVSATSWVRMMAAPLRTASRWAASDPPTRSSGADCGTESMKRLRDAPTRIGRLKRLKVSSLAIASMLCSGVLPKPMPGSSTMHSRRMPAFS